MNRIGFLGIATCLLVAVSAIQAETVTVAAFEFPPFYQDGPTKGLSCDLVAAAFEAVKVQTEFRFLPPGRMVQFLTKGETVCGLGAQALFASPEIAPSVQSVTEINPVSLVFFYDGQRFPNGFDWSNPASLANQPIGVLANNGIGRSLEKNPGYSLVPNQSHDGTARQLRTGRIYLWAVVDLTGLDYIRQLFPDETSRFQYSPPFERGSIALAFSRKSDPDGLIAARFREGLALIKKNGSYLRILAEYYGGKERINRESLPEDLR